jgi:hypothetical protein
MKMIYFNIYTLLTTKTLCLYGFICTYYYSLILFGCVALSQVFLIYCQLL